MFLYDDLYLENSPGSSASESDTGYVSNKASPSSFLLTSDCS